MKKGSMMEKKNEEECLTEEDVDKIKEFIRGYKK